MQSSTVRTREGRRIKVLGEDFAFRTLLFAGALLAAALVWTVVIPGVVAWHDGVFYEEDIQQHLPQAARSILDEARHKELLLGQAKRRIEERAIDLASGLGSAPAAAINGGLTADTIATLVNLHSHLNGDLTSAAPAITVAPFYLNPQLWLWPSIYFCLGFIAVVLRPSERLHGSAAKRSVLVYCLLACAIYCLYEWPLWLRNFVFSSHGRTLFAYTNYDIDPSSFLMQEGVILGFCTLLAIIWTQWFSLPLETGNHRRKAVLDQVLDREELGALSELLFRWQCTSVVLAAGFGFFSNFFWRIVFQFHDQRYVISAILAHLLWATTWIGISIPLVVRWQRWESARWQAVAQVEEDHSRPAEDKRTLLDTLKDIRPGGFAYLVGSAALAACSFIFPVVKELL